MPPWLKVRTRMLLFTFIDVILSSYFFNTFFKPHYKFNYSILFLKISLSGIWIVSSYLTGRLSKKNKFSLNKKLFVLFLETLKASIITLIIFIFYLDLPKLEKFVSLVSIKNVIVVLLPLAISSFLIHSLIDLLFQNVLSDKREILIVGGNKESIEKLFDCVEKSNHSDFYKFYTPENICNNKLFKEVLVLDSSKFKIINNHLFRKLLMDECSIQTPANWFAQEFQRIPSFLLQTEELIYKRLQINNSLNSFSGRIKRFGDISISTIILFITIPILLISSVLIFIEDQGPIFYSQNRVGKSGQEIKIWKLRTMCVEAEKDGIRWASKRDERITNIGKFLRKYRIDELPQLFSVIQGQMSLIGPRPERGEIEKTIEKNIPNYYLRNLVKPGLSGWAQVNYPYGASIEDSKIKLSYDLFYINNYSFWLDLLIFFKTIRIVFNASGAIPK